MEIVINGEKKEVADDLDLMGLLKQFKIEPQAVVVEKNEAVIPRTQLDGVELTQGDKIEIVRFVGGG